MEEANSLVMERQLLVEDPIQVRVAKIKFNNQEQRATTSSSHVLAGHIWMQIVVTVYVLTGHWQILHSPRPVLLN